MRRSLLLIVGLALLGLVIGGVRVRTAVYRQHRQHQVRCLLEQSSDPRGSPSGAAGQQHQVRCLLEQSDALEKEYEEVKKEWEVIKRLRQED